MGGLGVFESGGGGWMGGFAKVDNVFWVDGWTGCVQKWEVV